MLVRLLCLFVVVALGAGASAQRKAAPHWLKALQQSRRQVGVGVHLMSARVDGMFGGPQSLHVVEIEPDAKRHRYRVVQAKGRQKTSVLGESHRALIAINGGYFHKDGSPHGWLRIGERERGAASYAGQKGVGMLGEGRLVLGDMPPAKSKARKRLRGAIGCGPFVLDAGKVVDHGAKQRRTRHPRTAVGLRKDGSIVWLVVDGRHKRALGMSFEEMGHVFLALGCVRAVNLDGGGSSTLWIDGRGVVNNPSDNKRLDAGGERAVGNALLLLAPAAVQLDNDVARITIGGRPLAAAPQSRTKQKGYVGAGYYWFARAKDPVRAEWKVTAPRGGNWRVLARWPRLQMTRAARVQVTMPGRAPRFVDQRVKGGHWVSLGEFVAKGELRVALEAVGVPLTVDAVRFVEVGGVK